MAYNNVEGGSIDPLIRYCDDITGLTVAYSAIIRNSPTQTSKEIFFDLTYTPISAQPVDSSVCGRASGPNNDSEYFWMCRDELGDGNYEMFLRRVVTDSVTVVDGIDRVQDYTFPDMLPVATPFSFPSGEVVGVAHDCNCIRHTTDSYTSGVTNILSTATNGAINYTPGDNIRSIEFIVKDEIDLTVTYTKRDTSTVVRTISGAGVYVYESQLNEAEIVSVDVTNLTAEAGNYIINAVSKRAY
jgi:hypothetical protein